MRSYERPLFALMTVLTLLLLLAIFQPRSLLLDVPEQQASSSQNTPAGATPVAALENAQKASKQQDGSGTTIAPPPDSQGPPYHDPDTLNDRPSEQLLCSAPQQLSVLTSNGLAVAADPDGHYTLYSLPNAQTGLPADNSYELLRGCLPTDVFANTLAIEISNPSEGDEAGKKADAAHETRVVPADGSTTVRTTRRIKTDKGQQLITTYEAPGGVRFTQRLGLQAGKLAISYDLDNRSKHPAGLALRTILSPTPANPDQDVLFEVPNAGPEAGITRDTVLRNGAGTSLNRIWSPRPAAASDSTALWEPGTGPEPEKVTFAGFHRLRDSRFDYGVEDHYPLPPNASMAVYWQDLTLEPGQTMTFGHTYGPETGPDGGR